MQASNGETRGLEGTVRTGQTNLEKRVSGNWANHPRMVATAERKTRACGPMGYLLPEIFLSGG